ncbi:hypothetical protein LOD99_4777 [Oopsacas minuta]|uniref:Uncharacterized protein n=1 Tax=Oopsacas minuta TaxID=111878 RepID=A0AAV7JSE6_9METZ|nr:hypothetical protein LOD99_4777 [Oopsacas minuta]
MSKLDSQETIIESSNTTKLNQSNFDQHIYDTGDKFEGYLPSLHLTDHHEDEDTHTVQADIPMNLGLTDNSKIDEPNSLFDRYDQRKKKQLLSDD